LRGVLRGFWSIFICCWRSIFICCWGWLLVYFYLLLAVYFYLLLGLASGQTPTLSLCVARHNEIEAFIPRPFWVVAATVVINGRSYPLEWANPNGQTFREKEAQDAKRQANQNRDRGKVVLDFGFTLVLAPTPIYSGPYPDIRARKMYPHLRWATRGV